MKFLFFFFSLLALPQIAFARINLRMVGPEDIGGVWEEIIHRFESANTDITVEYISGPWSTDERQNMYIRSFLGGKPFELVYMDVTWTPRFASKGWLLPLDKWFTAKMQQQFLPADIEAGYYKGHIYRVPVRTDAGVLYYRKDLIPEPPRTWKEFQRVCERLSSPPDLYCIVFQGRQYEGLVCNYLEYLWGAGGQVLDKNGEVRLDSPEGIRALLFMRTLIDNNWAPRAVISFQEQQTLEFFQQGRALFMRNWPYAWSVLNKSPLKGKVGIAPFIHEESKVSSSTLGGWGLGVAKRAEHPEAAWKFLEYASSAEAQKILHMKRGAVPTRKALFKDEGILRDSPHYRELYQVLLKAKPRPVNPEYPRISSAIQKHVSSVLVGRESPEGAAEAMDRSIIGVLKGKRSGLVKRLFLDYDLRNVLKNTALFTMFSVPLELLLGLLFALALNLPLKGRKLGRLAVLIPWALPTAVMAMSWQWMFSNPFGVINDLLLRLGAIGRPIDWLSIPRGAMFAAIFADIWKTTPFVAIILLAGLQSVPRELEEGLQIEGAGPVKKFFHLTLPMLLPFIRVALVFRIIHAAGIFDLIWVLTGGGPADSTKTLALYIYELAFKFDAMGYALLLTGLFLIALMASSVLVIRAGTLRYERVRA